MATFSDVRHKMMDKLQLPVGVRTFDWCGAKVYLMENIQKVAMAEVERLTRALPQWRREKVLAMKNDDVRRESVLAFALLMTALRQEWQIEEEVEFEYNEHGKPQLARHADIHFNISHCREAVACVIADREVGIDVECRGRYKETLARHILSEREWTDVQNSDDRDLVFTILWTKKEAMVKRTGTGISGGMKQVLDECQQDDITTYIEERYVCSIAM